MKKMVAMSSILKDRSIDIKNKYWIEFLMDGVWGISRESIVHVLFSILHSSDSEAVLDYMGRCSRVGAINPERVLSLDEFELRIKHDLPFVEGDYPQLGLYYCGNNYLPKGSFIPGFGKLLVCTKEYYTHLLEQNRLSIRDAAFLFYFKVHHKLFAVSCGVKEGDFCSATHHIGKWWFANFGGAHDSFSYLGEPNCRYHHVRIHGEYRNGLFTTRTIRPGEEMLTPYGLPSIKSIHDAKGPSRHYLSQFGPMVSLLLLHPIMIGIMIGIALLSYTSRMDKTQ